MQVELADGTTLEVVLPDEAELEVLAHFPYRHGRVHDGNRLFSVGLNDQTPQAHVCAEFRRRLAKTARTQADNHQCFVFRHGITTLGVWFHDCVATFGTVTVQVYDNATSRHASEVPWNEVRGRQVRSY